MEQQHESPRPALQTSQYNACGTQTADFAPADVTANALPDAAHASLEDYLDQVCAPLVSEAPYATRQEWRAELRAHLEALSLAHIELGASPAEALESALRQFGEPRKIANHLTREWLRAGLQTRTQSLASATLTGLGVFSASLFLTGWLDMYPPIQAVWCIVLITVLGALAAGMMTAALVRAHAVLAVHNAAWILGLGFLAVLTRWQGMKSALPVALAALFCGLVFGCLGACLEKRSHWLRRKIRRRAWQRA